MRQRSSPKRMDDEENNEMDTLFEDIDEIEKILEPLQGAQADSLRSLTEDKKKKLESVDDEKSSSFKLSFLRKEISKLKERAKALANNSFVTSTSLLRNEIDDIEKSLGLLKDEEAEALRSKVVEQKKKLESVNKTEFPSVQQEIVNIRENAETLSTKVFLLNEIGLIERMLVTVNVRRSKRADLRSLELEKEEKKNRLQSADKTELTPLRKEISNLKERAERLATKESWLEKLSRVSAIVWLSIIPLLILIYSGWIAGWQWRVQPTIQTLQVQTATAQTATAAVMQTETAAVNQTATAQAMPASTEASTSSPIPTP